MMITDSSGHVIEPQYMSVLNYDLVIYYTLPAFCDVPLLYVNCEGR